MQNRFRFVLFSFCFVSFAFAAPQVFRWTGNDDTNAELTHVLHVLQQKSGVALEKSDFILWEDRDLAHTHFRMYFQIAKGIPIDNQTIRIWTSLSNHKLVQLEARISEPPVQASDEHWFSYRLDSQTTLNLVRNVLAQKGGDNAIRQISWRDTWQSGEVVRSVTVKSSHGKHLLRISVASRKVLEAKYDLYPQSDATSEFSIPVRIYPVYEETARQPGIILPRIKSELRYLETQVRRAKTDPYVSLRNQRYPESKMDPVLGMTSEGRDEGFWAMGFLKEEAAKLYDVLPLSENDFSNGGVILEGRYTTVNIHPDAPSHFKPLHFVPQVSALFKPSWQPMPENLARMEMVPRGSLKGRPIVSSEDAWTRPAERLAVQDPAVYMNDGFDEIQVYWAVNQLFDSLRPMGFTDPELSTRRFNAFLYDPDITMRDNAFYTDDTINFTTYSPKNQNFARDNTTIWHELGHGVMDRLMGDEIRLADTGGLSEGMADFVAQLVINDVTGGAPFPGKDEMRIFNHTGFYLTNEVHDDGEAYGGTMNDLLMAAMERDGRKGLEEVTDLTLETMRLTRNHYGLTAVDWFNHMLFADDLGNEPLRSKGSLRELILSSLKGRNFNLDGSSSASMSLRYEGSAVTAGAPGSRPRPVAVRVAPHSTADFLVEMQLKSSADYQFHYPVTVKVAFADGALQGAVHWVGKEKGPQIYTLSSESDSLPIALSVTGTCDQINQPDGTCVDYAYVEVWNNGVTGKPEAKKRFYVHVIPSED